MAVAPCPEVDAQRCADCRFRRLSLRLGIFAHRDDAHFCAGFVLALRLIPSSVFLFAPIHLSHMCSIARSVGLLVGLRLGRADIGHVGRGRTGRVGDRRLIGNRRVRQARTIVWACMHSGSFGASLASRGGGPPEPVGDKVNRFGMRRQRAASASGRSPPRATRQASLHRLQHAVCPLNDRTIERRDRDASARRRPIAC
jgi:hypothetical protein